VTAHTTHWTEYTPQEALAQELDLSKRLDIFAPRNEEGQRCPWPWEPEQLVNVPLGQYHCPYCGAMVLAGLPHLDYVDEDPTE
jgi:hypothetical protein